MSGFQKAERKQVKLKLNVQGPSGSGKTYSALLIAAGMGKKIALVDTENDSASLYAGEPGIPEFDTLPIRPPFYTKKYVDAIRLAIQGGYEVLVIDSTTHQWSGEGGIMDRMDKEKMAKPGQNSYTAWAKYTPEHEEFKQAIVQSPIHIICTTRSKQDYSLDKDEKTGKATPRKVGMAPVQRDQFEYEFTTVFDLSMEHYATVSKDRTGLFDGKHFVPSQATGQALVAWLSTGKALEIEAQAQIPASSPPVEGVIPPQLTQEERAKGIALKAIHNPVTWPQGSISDYCASAYGEDNPVKLSQEQFESLLYLVKHQTASQARVNLKAAAALAGEVQ